MEHANILKARMVEKDINARQVAARLGVSTASVSNKINGRTDFTAKEIKELAGILELKPQEVFEIFFS